MNPRFRDLIVICENLKIIKVPIASPHKSDRGQQKEKKGIKPIGGAFKNNSDYRRNIMAKIRTLMANERTLMSYYRSSLALVGLSAFVFKFYVSVPFIILSALFALAAVALAIYGTIKYLRFKRRILRK